MLLMLLSGEYLLIIDENKNELTRILTCICIHILICLLSDADCCEIQLYAYKTSFTLLRDVAEWQSEEENYSVLDIKLSNSICLTLLYQIH